MRDSTNTLSRLILSTESTTERKVQVSDSLPARARRVRANKSVQNAVYGYIRAVRALGRTKISTAEVADALSLKVPDVNGALSSLKKKGVKALNG